MWQRRGRTTAIEIQQSDHRSDKSHRFRSATNPIRETTLGRVPESAHLIATALRKTGYSPELLSKPTAVNVQQGLESMP